MWNGSYSKVTAVINYNEGTFISVFLWISPELHSWEKCTYVNEMCERVQLRQGLHLFILVSVLPPSALCECVGRETEGETERERESCSLQLMWGNTHSLTRARNCECWVKILYISPHPHPHPTPPSLHWTSAFFTVCSLYNFINLPIFFFTTICIFLD